MAYWLLKTEPSDYSLADLMREGRTVWSGIKNALARIHLKAMKVGDEVLIYHTGDEKAVVGTARVIRGAAHNEPEPTVEIGKARALRMPVELARIREEKRFREWALVKIGRLSVVPTTKEQYELVLELAGMDGK